MKYNLVIVKELGFLDLFCFVIFIFYFIYDEFSLIKIVFFFFIFVSVVN